MHREAGQQTVQDTPPAADKHSYARPDQPFPTIPHNIDPEKQSAPLGHPNQPPTQDLRLPAPHPAASSRVTPRFPSAQQKRHSISLLVDVWLFVSSLYLRAELFEDAKGAVDEAQKLVKGFESDLAREESSARAFDERGWGSGKSVGRLWGDVWAEVSFHTNASRGGLIR